MTEQAKQFELELKALLQKYNATISADDHWQGYSECGQDIRITVEFKNTFAELNLGRYFDKESFSKDKPQ